MEAPKFIGKNPEPLKRLLHMMIFIFISNFTYSQIWMKHPGFSKNKKVPKSRKRSNKYRNGYQRNWCSNPPPLIGSIVRCGIFMPQTGDIFLFYLLFYCSVLKQMPSSLKHVQIDTLSFSGKDFFSSEVFRIQMLSPAQTGPECEWCYCIRV